MESDPEAKNNLIKDKMALCGIDLLNYRLALVNYEVNSSRLAALLCIRDLEREIDFS